MKSLRERIWGDVDPYDGAERREGLKPGDVQGWRRDHPLLDGAASEAQRIVEVGVWKGASVVDMARCNPYCDILAVDHWRGCVEHWTREKWHGDVRTGFYETFLSNIASLHLDSRVVPFPADSRTAALACEHWEEKFDLVHIDGSHDFGSCCNDLLQWSRLLDENGVIVLDDYQANFPGVDKAVAVFCERKPWEIRDVDSGKCLLGRIDGA